MAQQIFRIDTDNQGIFQKGSKVGRFLDNEPPAPYYDVIVALMERFVFGETTDPDPKTGSEPAPNPPENPVDISSELEENTDEVFVTYRALCYPEDYETRTAMDQPRSGYKIEIPIDEINFIVAAVSRVEMAEHIESALKLSAEEQKKDPTNQPEVIARVECPQGVFCLGENIRMRDTEGTLYDEQAYVIHIEEIEEDNGNDDNGEPQTVPFLRLWCPPKKDTVMSRNNIGCVITIARSEKTRVYYGIPMDFLGRMILDGEQRIKDETKQEGERVRRSHDKQQESKPTAPVEQQDGSASQE